MTTSVGAPSEQTIKDEYRRLRDQLLVAETALKDQRENVAAFRRQLPMGAAVETDYVFREGPADIRDESPAHFKDVAAVRVICTRQGSADCGSHDVGRQR
jgi:hypothetical protein